MNETIKFTWIDKIALRIRPSLAEKSGIELAGQLMTMMGLILGIPIMLIGMVWLIAITDFRALNGADWIGLLITFVLMAILERIDFHLQMQVTKVSQTTGSGTLGNMVLWSAILMFGPMALWSHVILANITFAVDWYRESSINVRWHMLRRLIQDLGLSVVAGLCGSTLYQQLGGTFPLPNLAWSSVRLAIFPTLVFLIVPLILFFPLIRRFINSVVALGDVIAVTPLQTIQFIFLAMNLSNIALPFSILAAGLYGEYGIGNYLFFNAGVLSASILANRLSQSAQLSQQRSRELAILESLGRDIINTPPNDLQLAELLPKHLDGMLLNSLLTIWLEPDTMLFQSRNIPQIPNIDEAKALLQQQDAPYYQLSGVRLPDETMGRIARNGIVIPISNETGQLLGGIYVLLRENLGDVMDFLPAMQSLSSQIASALNREAAYAQTLASEKMAQELELAGRIQATFLPDTPPDIQGWDISAAIVPARQTSGDFYDYLDLGNGRFAIIVADVADKGTGAALYMALSRTLIRTYATQFPDSPAEVFLAANERILADTFSDQFVTVFYGVLNNFEQTLTYANAGHNPAYLVSKNGRSAPQELSKTGIPLGIFEELSWRNNVISFAPGDCLIMYTDGVTEAHNHANEEFGEERLLDIVKGEMGNGRSAQHIQENIIDAIHTFTGDAPQFDDITLMILQREV